MEHAAENFLIVAATMIFASVTMVEVSHTLVFAIDTTLFASVQIISSPKRCFS